MYRICVIMSRTLFIVVDVMERNQKYHKWAWLDTTDDLLQPYEITYKLVEDEEFGSMPALTETIMWFDQNRNYHISMVELQNFIEHYYFSDLTNERINGVLGPQYQIPVMEEGDIKNTDGITHGDKQGRMNKDGTGNPFDDYANAIYDTVASEIEEIVDEIEANEEAGEVEGDGDGENGDSDVNGNSEGPQNGGG